MMKKGSKIEKMIKCSKCDSEEIVGIVPTVDGETNTVAREATTLEFRCKTHLNIKEY